MEVNENNNNDNSNVISENSSLIGDIIEISGKGIGGAIEFCYC
jgi:hypothetical protein